jgi:general secretion pathway protein G
MTHRHGKTNGFTLIELLVVMTIIATLLSVVAPHYFRASDDAREAALKANLSLLREAIDHFHGDRGIYPETLSELVERRYLRSIPQDPFTGSPETWKLLPPPELPPEKTAPANSFEKTPTFSKTPPPPAASKGVYDVRSGAVGTTREGAPFETL